MSCVCVWQGPVYGCGCSQITRADTITSDFVHPPSAPGWSRCAAMKTASNSVVASVFFLASLTLDALSAIDSSAHADSPASLRGVSLILVACLAAPLIKNSSRGVYGLLQRPLIGVGLSICALLGLHHGSSLVRTFDALYTTFAGLIVIYLFSSGGLDERSKASKRDVMQAAVMKSSSTLAGALLFYASMRTVRAGVQHTFEVQSFTVDTGTNSTLPQPGYAFASSIATSTLVAGGAVGVAAAVLVLSSHVDLSLGTDTLVVPLCAAGMFQLLAALACSLTYADQAINLPAIFGSTSCKSDESVCAAAIAARRFAVANTPVSSMWVSALGLLTLGFPPSARLREKSNAFSWSVTTTTAGSVTAVAAILIVYYNATFDGRGAHTDYVLISVIVAIYLSFFVDSVAGTLVYISSMVMEEVFYIHYYGFSTLFSHLTHLTLVVTIVLLSLHTIVQFSLTWFRFQALYVFAGVLTAAGVSLSLGLFMASASLLSVSNGNLGNLQETSDGKWFAFTFVLHHFFPLLAWLPLVVCRCEIHILNSWQRMVVWVASLPILLLVYVLCLVVIDETAPTLSLLDQTAVWGAVVGVGLAPWLVSCFV